MHKGSLFNNRPMLYMPADMASQGSQIFLSAASVDLLALMDQTTLAASLYIIGNALRAGDQVSWIASGYFM